MDIFYSIISVFKALWVHDYVTLADPKLIWTLYCMLFLILFFENGVLPAAFLPGDSLLILTGALASNSNINVTLGTLLIVLIAGASCGTWFGYLQGRWLGNTKVVQNWLEHLPEKYHIRAHDLFYRHGLAALFISRFIAFVRTLLPMLAGLSGLTSKRFQIYNWLSSALWVVILVGVGYLFGLSSLFKQYEQTIMSILMLLPVILLIFGLIASVIVVLKRKAKTRKTAIK